MADTVLRSPSGAGDERQSGSLVVSYALADGRRQQLRFSRTFCIGRDKACEVCLPEEGVSRRHTELIVDATGWSVRDLGSLNGTLLDDRSIQCVHLADRCKLQLGPDGPVLHLELESKSRAPAARRESMTRLVSRYLSGAAGTGSSERSVLMRRVVQHAARHQSRRYRLLIASVFVLLLAALGVAAYQYRQLQNVHELARGIFYDMKAIELQIAAIETSVRATEDRARLAEVAQRRAQREAMERSYNELLQEAGVIDRNMSPEDRVILRLARIFGECELDMPDGFVKEVKSHIAKWRSNGRLEAAIQRMHDNDFDRRIVEALRKQNLPAQFLYLALQESDFRRHAVGPQTRSGIAKGIWQFIPETAEDYGLLIGPWASLPRFDPDDERFDFDKATDAASRYLRDIYATEAQASGLLVVASYNWGHNRVRKLVSQLPKNPRDRNFWQLLKRYRVPEETYDYVFSIFSAAVIGEDPGLFGFSFENPLEAGASREQARAGDTPDSSWVNATLGVADPGTGNGSQA